MKNLQVIELFRKLNASDLPEIEDFLESKFLNRSPLRADSIRMFNFLRELHPEMNEGKLEKDDVHRLIFPGKEIVAGKIDKIASELSKLIREYLVYRYYQSEEAAFDKALHMGRVYRQLNLDDRFKLHLGKTDREHFQQQPLSSQYYYRRFRLEYEHFLWESAFNKGQGDLNLSTTLESLVSFFEIYRLDLLNVALLQSRFTQKDVSPVIEKYVNVHLGEYIENDNPVYQIISLIHQLLLKKIPESNDFYQLMSILDQRKETISINLLRDAYTHLRNVCTWLINAGHDHLVPVLHQLQKDNLATGYFFIDGRITHNAIISIIRIACMDHKAEWALDIIERHRGKIIGDDIEETYYHFGKALCLFYLNKFEDCLTHLPATCDNLYIYMTARRLETMCYYELKSDLVIYKIEAFKMYVKRAANKSVSENILEPNRVFINMFLQLLSTTKGEKGRSERIIKRVKEKEQVAESKWLIAKALELA